MTWKRWSAGSPRSAVQSSCFTTGSAVNIDPDSATAYTTAAPVAPSDALCTAAGVVRGKREVTGGLISSSLSGAGASIRESASRFHCLLDRPSALLETAGLRAPGAARVGGIVYVARVAPNKHNGT